jgi:hypothetical protein
MIIDYFHIKTISVSPNKTESPLIVDANAVPAFKISSQSLEAISRRRSKIP